MAETVRTVAEDSESKIRPMKSKVLVEEVGEPARVACSDMEKDKNDPCGGSRKDYEIRPKGQELPEPIRHKDESKGMMPCLPSINLLELTTILRDPNMPSKKILNEVADKIMLKSEESESDDGSVSSGVVGMKGLLDCIFEVTYMHEDSASSDDDDTFERISREIPCNFCSKIFGSTMTWNTHVLVAHAQQDSSVLNIRKVSANEDNRKDKSHPSHRKHLRSTSKPGCDAKGIKVHHTPTDSKQTKEFLHGEENVPIRKRRSSVSRLQQKEATKSKSDLKFSSAMPQVQKESLPKERELTCSVPSCDAVKGTEGDKAAHQNETAENADHRASADEPDNDESCSAEKKCRRSIPTDIEPTPFSDQSSREVKDAIGKQLNSEAPREGLDVPANPATSDIYLSSDAQSRRKRTSPPHPESTLSLPKSSSSKRSRKNVAQERVSTSQHKQSDSSASEVTPTDEQSGI